MYNLLEIIIHMPIKEEQIRFTPPELQALTGLCIQSVSNNISRLVKAGLLIRNEAAPKERNQRGRVIIYTMESDIIDFATNVLFNNNND